MVTEAEIEKPAVALASTAGWFVRKVEWPGRRGAPDRVFIKDGRVVWIEFKSPTGKLSLLQEKEIKRMREAGAEVHVCSDLDDVRGILGIT
jgi:hypothetical protein